MPTNNIFSPSASTDIVFPPWNIDTFGRQRVSLPVTQIQLTQSMPSSRFFFSEGAVSGIGTSSNWNLQGAYTDLTVSNEVGIRRLRSKTAGLYQSGKSLLYLFTFNFLSLGAPNIKKRAGYFDNSNGIYLMQENGILYWVLRSSASGTLVETIIAQSEWDSEGLPQYSIDQTKSHIAFIEMEWLGVGDISCGFIQNKEPRVAHFFRHENALNSVYMTSANLFATFEIERTVRSAVVSSESFRSICCALLTEGEDNSLGTQVLIRRALGGTAYSTGTANNTRALLLFRLNPTYVNSRAFVTDFEISTSSASATFYLSIVRSPQFNSAVTPTWVDVPNSSLQYDASGVVNTNFVTNATTNTVTAVAATVARASAGDSVSSLNFANSIGSNFDGTPDIWALCIACTTANINVETALVKILEQI